MAIKIPSKNIYEMNNPKIRDNVIDNVSVEQTIITPNNEYEVSVYNTKEENIKNTFVESGSDSSTYFRGSAIYEYEVTALFALVKAYYFDFSIKVPRLTTNSCVSTLIDKQEDIVKVTVYTREKSGTASGEMQHSSSSVDNKDYIIATNIITNYTSEKPTTINSLSNYENKISFEPTKVDIYGDTLFAKIEIQDNSSIKSPIIEEHDDYYVISASVLVGKEEISLYGYNKVAYTSFSSVSGECTYYEPMQIEITIYGNTIGIDLTDGSTTYIKDANGEIVEGKGNKPHSLSGNELLQDSAYKKTNAILNITDIVETQPNFNFNKVYFDNVNINGELNYDLPIYIQGDNVNSYRLRIDILGHFINATKGIFPTFAVGETINVFQKNPLKKIIAENVLTQYAKGKETTTILCDINDYYNENDEKVIDITSENMSFRLHDEVIPYVFGANGQDQPMSKYQDGTAKVFEVVGSNIIYDGAVWQELTLLEKN